MKSPRHDDDGARLTEEECAKLRRLEHTHPQRALAKMLGTSPATVNRLASGGMAKKSTVERVREKMQ